MFGPVIVGPSVLPGNDMLDVVPTFAVLLGKHAILAAVVRASADKLPHCGVHPYSRFQTIASFELNNRDEIQSIDQCLVFIPFVLAQQTFISPFSESIHSGLDRGTDGQLNQPPSRFAIEALAEWVQDTVERACGAHAPTLPQHMPLLPGGS